MKVRTHGEVRRMPGEEHEATSGNEHETTIHESPKEAKVPSHSEGAHADAEKGESEKKEDAQEDPKAAE
jgi:hypothetical protein